jgi:hypothetical protein
MGNWQIVMAVFAMSFIAVGASAQSDDFDDDTTGTEWGLVGDVPSKLNAVEQNGRVEIITDGTAGLTDEALYVSNGSNGFKLPTSSDFVTRIDVSLSDGVESVGGLFDAFGLVFGVGRDAVGTDGAAIGLVLSGGDDDLFEVIGEYRTDGQRSFPDVSDSLGPGALLSPPTTGTFTVSYNSAADDVTLRYEPDGSFMTYEYTLEDTVRGVWGADDLFVSFGGYGNGFALEPGEGYFDNFEAEVIPGPATALLALPMVVALRRGRGRDA